MIISNCTNCYLQISEFQSNVYMTNTNADDYQCRQPDIHVCMFSCLYTFRKQYPCYNTDTSRLILPKCTYLFLKQLILPYNIIINNTIVFIFILYAFKSFPHYTPVPADTFQHPLKVHCVRQSIPLNPDPDCIIN